MVILQPLSHIQIYVLTVRPDQRISWGIYLRKVFGTYTCGAALLGHSDYETNYNSSLWSLSIISNAETNLHICSLVWKSAGWRQGDCDLSTLSGRPLGVPSSLGGEM